MKLAMIGAGYVGLTTGACLAELGHEVVVFDIQRERIAQLRRSELPIYEPGLERVIKSMIAAGRLRFEHELEAAAVGVEAIFLAVGTPSRADGSIDLSQIEGAARSIASHLQPGALVIVKSTVAVGTCRRVREIIAERRGRLDFLVASNPEFLREGSAIADFMKPDRIVLGFDDPKAGKVLDRIYEPLLQAAAVCRTSIANAELTKHVANAFLAVKIGFANDVADLCEAVGGDVCDVMDAVGLDSRIGRAFLSAGPGYGGSCFPKDTRAYAHSGRSADARQGLVEAVIVQNRTRPARLAQRVIREARLERGSTVAILGMAFKANTDDVRESPAVEIGRALLSAGMRLRVHDPKAAANARRLLDGDAEFAGAPMDALQGAHAVILATEWEEYRSLDLRAASASMAGRHLFDFRNMLESARVMEADLVYHSIGRASVAPNGAKPARVRNKGSAMVLDHPAAASTA